jgi:hypothetical protein
MKKAGMLLFLTVAFGFVGGLGAQVPPPPLRNVRVQAAVTYDASTRVYTYHYTVTNPPENRLDIYQILISIDVPPDRQVVGSWDDSLPHDDTYQNPRKPITITLSDGRVFFSQPPEATPVALAEKAYGVKVLPHAGFSATGCGMDFTQTPTTVSLLNAPVQAGWSCAPGFEIKPGETRSGFRMTSYGLPGIREMEILPPIVDLEVAGLIPYEWFPEEDDPYFSEKLTQGQRRERELGMKVVTVGPVGPPKYFHPLRFVEEIRGYVEASVTYGWLMDPQLAQDLRDLLTDIGQRLAQEECPGLETLQKMEEFQARVRQAGPDQRTTEAEGLLYFNMEVLKGSVGFCLPETLELQPVEVRRALNEEVELTLRWTVGTRPVAGGCVCVAVQSGPHGGEFWQGVTDANGEFRVRYRGRALGVDEVAPGAGCAENTCEFFTDAVRVIWEGGPDWTLRDVHPPVFVIRGSGERIPLEETTVNIGTTAGPPTKVRFYLSVDPEVSSDDAVLGERSVPALEPEAESTYRQDVAAPALPPGMYWVRACVDPDNEWAELDETNNCQTLVVHIFAFMRAVENRPPDCRGAQASPGQLWPPNHGFRDVAITGVTDPDGDPVGVSVVGVWADEPVDVQGGGDGNTCPDAELAPLRVRAERQGGGNGRVYHIRFRAEDGRGGTCEGTVRVCVPHDQGQGASCGDEGPRYDVTVCPP